MYNSSSREDLLIKVYQEVNLKGTYLVSKAFAQSLAGKLGTLINISSTHALGTTPYQSGYSISKLAAVRMMEILHLGEL